MKKAMLLSVIMFLMWICGCASVSTTEQLTIPKDSYPRDIKMAVLPMGFFDREFKVMAGGEETGAGRIKKVASEMNYFSKVEKISLEEVELAVGQKNSQEDILRKLINKDFESSEKNEKFSFDKDYIFFGKVKGYDLLLSGKVISKKFDNHANSYLILHIIFWGGLLQALLLDNVAPHKTLECNLTLEMMAYDLKKEAVIWQRREAAMASEPCDETRDLIRGGKVRNKLTVTAYTNAVITNLEDLRSKLKNYK